MPVKAPIALAGGEAASAPDCALHFFMGPRNRLKNSDFGWVQI
jgi:hypothetical protein